MLFDKGAYIYDRMREIWRRPTVSRRIAVALVSLFICSGLGIVLKYFGWLPEWIVAYTPDSPFRAIQFAFTLVLIIEVIELIFAVADSVSRAVGKQLEIMGLILLREAFKDIGKLHTPINLESDVGMLLHLVASVAAALFLFVSLGYYMKLGKLHGYIKKQADMERYISVKKCVSLLLFAFFIGAAGHDVFIVLAAGKPTEFFHSFYSTLIFTDVLLVLVGQYFMPSFHATFRNSGYAVGTLLMRLALGAPAYLGAALCVFAAVYVVSLTWATSRFLPPMLEGRAETLPAARPAASSRETSFEESKRREGNQKDPL